MRLILLLLSLVAIGGCDRQKAEVQQGNEAAVPTDLPTQGVDRSQAGKPAPDTVFLGPDGGETRLTDLDGPLLVNFWATWCAPCVKELPTLDALSRRYAEKGGLAVIAMNQDRAPQGSVEAFFAKLKITDLGLEQDPEMKLSGALGVTILPTTILFDAQGREVWRFVGDLDWNGPEAAKLIAEANAGAAG